MGRLDGSNSITRFISLSFIMNQVQQGNGMIESREILFQFQQFCFLFEKSI
jgi:hypothetical protein